MNRVFQLVRAEDGTRTREVMMPREKLAHLLFNGESYMEGITPQDIVLCVGEEEPDTGEFSFSLAPLMSVETFVKYFRNEV